MKQLEYINLELCSTCTECCKIKNGTEYCEFFNSSIGCTLERNERPEYCLNYVCDKLFQNYKVVNKIEFHDEANKMLAEIIFDKENNKMTYNFDFENIDPEEIKSLSNYRLNICNQCENIVVKDEGTRCKLCGCCLITKSRTIYPFDENGKAVFAIHPLGGFMNVCPLKNW